MNDFVMVHLFECAVEPAEQLQMGYAVLVEARETFPLQQLFFALKMHLAQINEAFELQTDALTGASMEQHDAEFIQGVHQDAMLIVSGFVTS